MMRVRRLSKGWRGKLQQENLCSVHLENMRAIPSEKFMFARQGNDRTRLEAQGTGLVGPAMVLPRGCLCVWVCVDDILGVWTIFYSHQGFKQVNQMILLSFRRISSMGSGFEGMEKRSKAFLSSRMSL